MSKATGAAVNENNRGVYLTPEYNYVESKKGTNLYEAGYIASLTIQVDIRPFCFCHFQPDPLIEDKEIERVKMEKLKRIENSEWMKKETIYDIMLGSYSRYIFDGDNSKVHWMLINKEIPKYLALK